MREPDELEREEAERRRRLFGVLGLVQIGGLALLAVFAVGLLPRILASRFPALSAPWIPAAAATFAAFGAVGLSILRLRRMWRDSDRRKSGED